MMALPARVGLLVCAGLPFFSACVECEFLKARVPPAQSDTEALLRLLAAIDGYYGDAAANAALICANSIPVSLSDIKPVPARAASRLASRVASLDAKLMVGICMVSSQSSTRESYRSRKYSAKLEASR